MGELVTQVVGSRDELIFVIDARVGPKGEKGDPGDAGSAPPASTESEYVAGELLNGSRVVYVSSTGTIRMASNLNSLSSVSCVGIVKSSYIQGATATVTTFGEITEPSWSWTQGLPVFLGTGGLMTQTPPVPPALFSLQIGIATGVNTIKITIASPLFLEV